jgi:hypothetical protein
MKSEFLRRTVLRQQHAFDIPNFPFLRRSARIATFEQCFPNGVLKRRVSIRLNGEVLSVYHEDQTNTAVLVIFIWHKFAYSAGEVILACVAVATWLSSSS